MFVYLYFSRHPCQAHSQIFVETNHGGGDETRIDAIEVSGFPIE
jgi:hypothetical protein